MNCSALKDRASSFNGNYLEPRISPRFRTDIPSTSSSERSARQYPQTFIADILCRIMVSVVVDAAMSARPRSDIERRLIANRTTRFRQVDARAFEFHALWILKRLPPVLRLEARIFAALGKEVIERSRKVLQGLLQRLAVGTTEPFKFLL